MPVHHTSSRGWEWLSVKDSVNISIASWINNFPVWEHDTQNHLATITNAHHLMLKHFIPHFMKNARSMGCLCACSFFSRIHLPNWRCFKDCLLNPLIFGLFFAYFFCCTCNPETETLSLYHESVLKIPLIFHAWGNSVAIRKLIWRTVKHDLKRDTGIV